MSKTTFVRLGIEFSNILTSFFIEGIALIVLNGLIILRDLIPLNKADLNGKNSIIDRITIKKSTMFHPSFKYAYECKINPLDIILRMHSTMNTQLKNIPISFNF